MDGGLASPKEVILFPKSGFRGPNFRDGAGGMGAGSGPELAPRPVTHREAGIRPSLMITLIEPPLEMQQKGVAMGCQMAETCCFHPKTSPWGQWGGDLGNPPGWDLGEGHLGWDLGVTWGGKLGPPGKGRP